MCAIRILNKNSSNFTQAEVQATPDRSHGILGRITKLFTSVLDLFFAINPITKKREFCFFSTNWEKRCGKANYARTLKANGGIISKNDPRYGHYVRLIKEMGKELADHSPRKDLDFEFEVAKSQTPNACCLPGGKICFNLGLIKLIENNSHKFGLGPLSIKEKIGAILSHEMSHANAAHTARALSSKISLTAAYLFLFGSNRCIPLDQGLRIAVDLILFLGYFTLIQLDHFSKAQKNEFEADKYGMHLMDSLENRRFSPKAGIWNMKMFKQQKMPENSNWFSTHPTLEKRINANLQTWQELKKNHLRNKSIARAMAPKTP